MASSAPILKALYTAVDNRTNLYEIDTLGLDVDLANSVKEQAKSVACLIKSRNLLRSENPVRYQLQNHVPTLAKWVAANHDETPFAADEKFKDEPVAGFGTAFLIGRQLALTAAHCVCDGKETYPSQAKVSAMRLVFGFYMKAEDQCQKEFEESDVYSVENVVACERTLNSDWSVLKLDREVVGAAPLALSFMDEIPKGIPLYMLGHPNGLPLKLVTEAEVKENKDPDFFEAKLNAFAGNSGSPVFDQQTKTVVGILCSGQPDYTEVDDYKGSGSPRIVTAHYAGAGPNGWERCIKVVSLTFLKVALPSIDVALPPEIDRSKLIAGLNLVGPCTQQVCTASGKLVAIPFGIAPFWQLNTVASAANCPHCQTQIDFEKIDTMILSSCRYKIEGRNIKREKIEQAAFFNLMQGIERVMQFDLTQWSYINITTTIL